MKNKKGLITLIVVLVIAIIGGVIYFSTQHNTNSEKPNNNSVIKSETDSSKILIVYFSKDGENSGVGYVEKGNTQIMAEMTQKKLNADIFEIVPKNAYPEDYDDCVDQAEKERNENARPEIVGKIDNIENYTTIFMMMPVWWYDMPMCVYTFLDEYDLSGKTVNVLTTHAGSGLSGIPDKIQKEEPNAKVNGSMEILGTTAQKNRTEAENKLNSWLNELGYSDNQDKENGENMNDEFNTSLNINIDGKDYKLALEDNETTRNLYNKLPVEEKFKELNGNEKYYNLDFKLPTNSSNPGKINKGDVMLYGDNCLVIFYETFNTSYSYTRIGHIDNLPSLGKDSVKVVINK